MNLAIFASAYYPSLGGVEELCRQLALEYRRRDFGVAVLTNRWPRDLSAFESIEGVDAHRLAMRVPTSSAKSKIGYALTGASVRREMMGILRKFQPDLLHVQCVSCNAAYALMAKRVLGVPLVVTLQGELTMDASQVFQREAWAKRVMRESLEEADAITACSRQTLQEAENWFGSPFKERGRVIYNGISVSDAVAQPFPHPRPYILAIGRHVLQKGFDLLLRAMSELVKDSAFQHDLILAGDGPEHEMLRALAEHLELGRRVIFPGRVTHTSAMGLFAGCSFFVLPSRHEPLGIVNLEAMAAGKAIVASCVGGVTEIVKNEVNGITVPGDNSVALVAAMRRLASNPDLRQRLGDEGHIIAKGFHWPTIADQYVALYKQLK